MDCIVLKKLKTKVKSWARKDPDDSICTVFLRNFRRGSASFRERWLRFVLKRLILAAPSYERLHLSLSQCTVTLKVNCWLTNCSALWSQCPQQAKKIPEEFISSLPVDIDPILADIEKLQQGLFVLQSSVMLFLWFNQVTLDLSLCFQAHFKKPYMYPECQHLSKERNCAN